MKVHEFITNLGGIPNKVGRWEIGKGFVEHNNDKLIVKCNRKTESDLIMNNLYNEVPHYMWNGAKCIFTVPIRGGYAHYISDMTSQGKYGFYTERISQGRYFELIKLFNKFKRLGEQTTTDEETLNKFQLYLLSNEL